MRFIQVSCLGASSSSPSRMLRTKAAAEETILKEIPEVNNVNKFFSNCNMEKTNANGMKLSCLVIRITTSYACYVLLLLQDLLGGVEMHTIGK